MNTTLTIITGSCAALLLAIAAPARAADTGSSPSTPSQPMHMHHREGHGMRDRDMKWMGRGMMGGPMRGMHCRMMERVIHVPQLPPGNARLQLQMQGEIMQKVGEILSKYAAQVTEPPGPPAGR